MGRLYRRTAGGFWFGDYYSPEGKRLRRCLKTHDKAVAKERLRIAELGATTKARGQRLRLMDAIDEMVATLHDKSEATREFYREKGRRILKSLGNPYVHEIDRAMLAGYISRRLSKHDAEHGQAKPHTVQKELITIRRALREAHDRGALAALPPMPRFSPKYKPKKTWLEVEQFEAVCAELPEHRRLWASLAALAGANLSEVEAIRWESDVDFARGSLHIPGTKREARDRVVPLAPALRHRLLQVDEKLRRGPLVKPWGSVRRDLHAAVARVNRRAAELAAAERREPPPAIPKVSPNDLRRTFASWLVQAGVPTLTIAVLMGHSSTRMVELVYGKLARKNLDAAIAELPHFASAGEAREPCAEDVPKPVRIEATPDHSGDERHDDQES